MATHQVEHRVLAHRGRVFADAGPVAPLGGNSGDNIAELREAVYRLLEAAEIVQPSYPVLARAAQPLPATLGTLGAIHLATALPWKEQTGRDLAIATHDLALAVAAKATGLRVIGG